MYDLTLMRSRHSVRAYLDKPIEVEKVNALLGEIEEINAASGLHAQLVTEEPEAFAGSFKGCRNYFVMAGGRDRDEDIGYWGERLVLKAQELGLNTCWAALTYKKGRVHPELNEGEKVYIVIALGYGATQGVPHRSRPAEELSNLSGSSPDWFRCGVEAALLAPTAINQQKFYFEYAGGNKVRARAKLAFYAKMDLGIAKYHFELGAGRENFDWE